MADAAQIEYERKYGKPYDDPDPFNYPENYDDGDYLPDEDRECFWCGGTGWDEDDECACTGCQGTGLARHQVIW